MSGRFGISLKWRSRILTDKTISTEGGTTDTFRTANVGSEMRPASATNLARLCFGETWYNDDSQEWILKSPQVWDGLQRRAQQNDMNTVNHYVTLKVTFCSGKGGGGGDGGAAGVPVQVQTFKYWCWSTGCTDREIGFGWWQWYIQVAIEDRQQVNTSVAC